MFNNKRILGVIPARAGSKGLPNKNIRNLVDKPLIAWTIETAQESGVFDQLVVSTDSEEIKAVALEYEASVPFLRPEQLSSDEAKGMDVVLHAIDYFNARGERFDFIVYLQPTAPLRSKKDILSALKIASEKDADAIISVSLASKPPVWMNSLPKDGNMKDFIDRNLAKENRQKLQPYYQLNGAIFLAKWDYIREKESWFGEKSYAYIMPKERSVDIDDYYDLKFAEVLLTS